MEVKFKKNLAVLRRNKKLSQEQLAEKLDVSRQSVSKWESGEAYPEMKMLLNICDLFNVSLEDLVHGDVSAPDGALRKKYDKIFTSRARFVATGVGLIITGVTFLLAMITIFGEGDNVALAGTAGMFFFVAVGVILFIINAHAVDDFKKKHAELPTTIYKEEVAEEKISLHQKGIALGVGLILAGLSVLMVLTILVQNEVAGATALMAFIAAGAATTIYNAMQKSKYNIEKYNRENSEEYIEKNRKVGMISGIIMMSATVVFFLLGALANAWNVAWVVYPVCGIACGIVAMAMLPKRGGNAR